MAALEALERHEKISQRPLTPVSGVYLDETRFYGIDSRNYVLLASERGERMLKRMGQAICPRTRLGSGGLMGFNLLSCVSLLLCVFMAAPAARAQLDTSTIRGIVTDRSGAAIPGATVVITDINTNRSFTTRTN